MIARELEDCNHFGKMRIQLKKGENVKIPPQIQGQTPEERMDNVLRTLLRVSKEAIVKQKIKETQASV